MKKFGKKINDEIRNLDGRFNINKQLILNTSELLEFNCVCFRDYWIGENSALFNTMFSNGNFGFIIIKRDNILGWWTLAFRKLRQFLQFKIQYIGLVAKV